MLSNAAVPNDVSNAITPSMLSASNNVTLPLAEAVPIVIPAVMASPALVKFDVPSKIMDAVDCVNVSKFVKFTSPAKFTVSVEITNVVVPPPATLKAPLMSRLSAVVNEPFVPIVQLLKKKLLLINVVVPSKIHVESVVVNVSDAVIFMAPPA